MKIEADISKEKVDEVLKNRIKELEKEITKIQTKSVLKRRLSYKHKKRIDKQNTRMLLCPTSLSRPSIIVDLQYHMLCYHWFMHP